MDYYNNRRSVSVEADPLCCMPLESYSKGGMGLEMEADHVTTRWRFTVWAACSLKCRHVTLALHLSIRKSLVLKYICGQYSAAVCNTVYCALIRDHRSLDRSPLLAMVSCLWKISHRFTHSFLKTNIFFDICIFSIYWVDADILIVWYLHRNVFLCIRYVLTDEAMPYRFSCYGYFAPSVLGILCFYI